MTTMLTRTLPLLAALLGSRLLAGCASTAGGGALTLKQLQPNVDWKLTAYEQAVAAGAVTTGQAQRVAAARQAYEAAYQQAVTAAGGNLETPSPVPLQQAANQLVGVIDAVLADVP